MNQTEQKDMSLEEIIDEAKKYSEKMSGRNIMKYCNMAINKGRCDLSIEIIKFFYDYYLDMCDGEKCIKIVIKYGNIFVNNYDPNKYDKYYLDIAKITFEKICDDLLSFGTDEWDNRYCKYLVSRYYKIVEKDYDIMASCLLSIIRDMGKKYIRIENDSKEIIPFKNALKDLIDYYHNRTEPDYEEFRNLMFFAMINLDDGFERISNIKKFYDDKCCNGCIIKEKDKNDILKEFFDFLLDELDERVILNKNKQIVMKLIIDCGRELNLSKGCVMRDIVNFYKKELKELKEFEK